MSFHGGISAIFAPIFGIGILFGSVAMADGSHEVDHLPKSNFTAQLVKGADGLDHVLLKTPDNITEDLGIVLSLPAGTEIFHWGSAEEISSLVSEPQFNVKNMNYRMLHAVHGGAGFFFSLSRVDSVAYGLRCISYSLPRDVKALYMGGSVYLNNLLTMPYWEDSPRVANVEMALQAIGVNAFQLDNYSTWYVTWSSDLLVNPHLLNLKDLAGVKEPIEALQLLLKFDQAGDDLRTMPRDRWPELYDLFVKHRLTAHDKAELIKYAAHGLWQESDLYATYPVRILRQVIEP